SLRAIFYALGANIGIFAAKAVAAAMTGSGAMIAEAVHSLADCGNQGLLLFSVGGAFSVYEGIHKLMVPEPLERPWIAIGVLVVSVILEWMSLRACMQEVDKMRE